MTRAEDTSSAVALFIQILWPFNRSVKTPRVTYYSKIHLTSTYFYSDDFSSIPHKSTQFIPFPKFLNPIPYSPIITIISWFEGKLTHHKKKSSCKIHQASNLSVPPCVHNFLQINFKYVVIVKMMQTSSDVLGYPPWFHAHIVLARVDTFCSLSVPGGSCRQEVVSSMRFIFPVLPENVCLLGIFRLLFISSTTEWNFEKFSDFPAFWHNWQLSLCSWHSTH